MNPENARRIQELIEADQFNPETLCSGESWMPPSVSEIVLIRTMIPLSGSVLARRLAVNERTIRKWTSGQTGMTFTTWCCLCWLAGLGMLLEEPD